MELPKHYSLHSEEPKHFVIHDKRDNKTFKIAKKELHPAKQIQVMKMQKFSHGGEEGSIDDEEFQEAKPEVSNVPANPVDVNALTPTFAPSPTQNPLLVETPNSPMVGAENRIAVPDSSGLKGMQMPGMKESQAALAQSAQAQTQLGNDITQTMALGLNQLNLAHEESLARQQKIEAEHEDLKQKLLKGEIDPQRYFKNKTTGQRIGTAISLLLGGLGAGIANNNIPNYAQKFLDKAVDNDIEAQKASLGKTHTLLGLNMQKYHNEVAAEAATRLQINTGIQMQLHAAQSRATSQQAKAALQMQAGALEGQNAQWKQKINEQLGQMHSLGYGGGDGGFHINQEPASLLLNPKYQEKRVQVGNKVYQSTSKDEAEKLRRSESIAGPVVTQINELRELSNNPMTKIAGSEPNLKAHSIMGNLAVQMPQMTGLTRVNEVEIKHLLDSLSDPTRMDQAFGDVKNQNALKTIEDDLESKRATTLIGYKGYGKMGKELPSGMKLPRNK